LRDRIGDLRLWLEQLANRPDDPSSTL